MRLENLIVSDVRPGSYGEQWDHLTFEYDPCKGGKQATVTEEPNLPTWVHMVSDERGTSWVRCVGGRGSGVRTVAQLTYPCDISFRMHQQKAQRYVSYIHARPFFVTCVNRDAGVEFSQAPRAMGCIGMRGENVATGS
jgi:hypothetical protein